ncbi:hypothetical protein [Novosphingobium malaysiense]|uniref:Uncharacterized protein n=1 Tax=Novosphingobium malaysiense TaxID=1348853 RepID=A0A0B1ZV88_9SPHN|nr:hypothetical protein [Novosphingobium malaysiense]KHK93037.1 hypothetical protein LK12_01275 [Novosphingobium malaysiense]
MDNVLSTYRLRFANDAAGVGKTIEFRAPDASEALLIAKNEAADRDVELWQGTKLLCHLRRSREEVWLIQP